MDLTDQVAVITGGASGIGAAVKERLEAEGARAAAWDVSASADVACDVRDPASVAAAMSWTIQNLGSPTVLVAAAGVATHGPFVDVAVEEWDRVLEINLRGVFVCIQAVAREMIAQRSGGSIVAIASVNGVLADPLHAPYAISKAGVIQLARVAARELGKQGIRVNAVGPGPTDTPMLADSTARADYVAEVVAATPLGRLGTPQLVADAIVELLKMDWVTGQTLLVDGGSSLATARGERRVRYHGESY